MHLRWSLTQILSSVSLSWGKGTGWPHWRSELHSVRNIYMEASLNVQTLHSQCHRSNIAESEVAKLSSKLGRTGKLSSDNTIKPSTLCQAAHKCVCVCVLTFFDCSHTHQQLPTLLHRRRVLRRHWWDWERTQADGSAVTHQSCCGCCRSAVPCAGVAGILWQWEMTVWLFLFMLYSKHTYE